MNIIKIRQITISTKLIRRQIDCYISSTRNRNSRQHGLLSSFGFFAFLNRFSRLSKRSHIIKAFSFWHRLRVKNIRCYFLQLVGSPFVCLYALTPSVLEWPVLLMMSCSSICASNNLVAKEARREWLV